MKKQILITSFAMMFALTSSAQFKIDSIGHVGIGTTNTQSTLSVGGGQSGSFAYINPTHGSNALKINNTRGIGIEIANTHTYGSYCTGLSISPGSGQTNQTSRGIFAYTGLSSTQNIGVGAAIPPIPTGASKVAAIYGSATSAENMLSGFYAGYFNGNARVTGDVTVGRVIISTSTANNVSAERITPYSAAESISEKMGKIDMVEIVQQLKQDDTDYENSPLLKPWLEENTELTRSDDNIIEKTNYHYGLDVKQLRELFPSLVCTDADGNDGINYLEIIPLLVQSVKELSAKVKELEIKLNSK